MTSEKEMTVTETAFDVDPDSLTGPLGLRHHVRFVDQGTDLLVHFATAPRGMDADQHHSALQVQARLRGWSLLSIVAEEGHDFRADPVIEFFDRCVDGAVFDRFGKVLFYGDDDGGYAALCYALAAPGARVVSVAPKAPRQTPGARYLPEPRNLETSAHIMWLDDPTMPNAVAPLPVTQMFTTRYLAPGAEARLLRYGLFWPLLEGAMADGFAPQVLYAGLRARHDDPVHVRRLAKICMDKGQMARTAVITGAFAKSSGRGRFRRSYNEMIETYDLQGFQPL